MEISPQEFKRDPPYQVVDSRDELDTVTNLHKDNKFALRLSPKTFYQAGFLAQEEADLYFKLVNELTGWQKNSYQASKLNRETLVFADDEIVDNPDKFKIPAIWGDQVVVVKFPPFMLTLLHKLREVTGAKYNIVLGNRYLKAKDRIAMHSDNEEFGNTQSIASISLGVARQFYFRAKDLQAPEDQSILLEHGSLIFMGENCQENYTHGMKNDKITAHPLYAKTRINLTFRVWNY